MLRTLVLCLNIIRLHMMLAIRKHQQQEFQKRIDRAFARS